MSKENEAITNQQGNEVLAIVRKSYPTQKDCDRWFEKINGEEQGKEMAKHYFMQGVEYMKLAIEEDFE